MRREVTRLLTTVVIRTPEQIPEAEAAPDVLRNVSYRHADPDAPEEEVTENNRPYQRAGEKIGRNQPCPCGSGKKYKHCHGKLT